MRSMSFSLLVLCLLLTGSSAQAYESENVRQLQIMSDGFAEIAAEVKPGVVAIATEGTVTTEARNPFKGSPLEEYFGAPEGRRERPRDGQGSGVIIDFRGEQYVVTNNHVIRNADDIRVQLSDARFFDAEVVGRDSLSDIAVLKIDAKDLPSVELGDSDGLREGEWVLAIGNPMGLAHSVTTGIVSAVGRGRFSGEYGSFIQTDAAINPGNSGGALVNLRGELIGVNTAIFSRSGGSIGIGFAIPVNLVKHVVGQLVEYGEVRRGLLGVFIGDLDPLVAEAMGLDNTQGAVIERVMKGKAAYKGGVKADDIVVEIEGYPILDSTELRSRIGRTAPGVEIELVVLRDGKKKKLNVVLEELTEDALAENSSRQEEDESQGPLGVNVQELTDQLAKQLGYEDDYGVLVSRVKSGSEAARRGLRRGMLIQTINRMKVESVEDFADVLEEIEPGTAFMMRVKARGEARLVGMRMPMD